MEPLINQHGLDVEALKSLPQPSLGGKNVGGSLSTQYTGTIANDPKSGTAGNEIVRPDALSRSLIGHGSSSTLETRSVQSQERHDAATWDTSTQNDVKISGKRKRSDGSSASEPKADNLQQADAYNLNTRKGTSSSERTGEAQLFSTNESGTSGLSMKTAVDNDGGTSNVLASSSRMFQRSSQDNSMEMNMPRGTVPRDAGESPMTQVAGAPNSPPKYTTSEKWIMDQQKRKQIKDQNWILKQQSIDRRVAACSEKLKDTVSSSEDISTKTKSSIELKKLNLLGLQRRLRSEILDDYFKPIASQMDRIKSVKKHRIGRRPKQVERFEQKMKEERQRRIHEKQKEFFSALEVHKERLDDVSKMKRERLEGFNKYAREYHKRKEGSEPIPSLPSRLITDDDLQTSMKIYEVPIVKDATPVGAKRKKGYVDGQDTQHNGRGKRAREVRSYEGQLTEEEFERLCQAESLESPTLKRDFADKNSPILATEPVMVTEAVVAETEFSAPLTVSQPSIVIPVEQSKEVTPGKRGRGRPKKTTKEKALSPVPPAVPEAKEADMGSPVSAVSMSPVPTASCSVSLPTSSLKSLSENSSQVGVCNDPSSGSTPLSSSLVPHGAQPISEGSPSKKVQQRGQARKTRGGAVTPSRRGRKKASLTAVPSTQIESVSLPPASGSVIEPSGTEKVDLISPRETVILTVPASNLDTTSVMNDQHDKDRKASPAFPVLQAPTEIDKVELHSEVQPSSSTPIVSGSDISASPVVKSVSGKMIQFGIGVAPPTSISDPFGSQSIPDDIPSTHQARGRERGRGRGRGRKPESGEGTSRGRGRKRDTTSGQDSKSEVLQVDAPALPGRNSTATERKRQTKTVEPTNVAQVQAAEIPAVNILSSDKVDSPKPETDAPEKNAIPSEKTDSQNT